MKKKLSYSNFLRKLEEGVFVIKDKSCDPPKNLLIDGIAHYRFMDNFYVICPLDELAKDQVVALCREREKFTHLTGDGTPNGKVRDILRNFAIRSEPNTLLEIGAGKSPCAPKPNAKQTFILSDFDDRYCHQTQRSDFSRYLTFSDERPLDFVENYFDVMLASFVFQFPIYPSQLREISRCLALDGTLLCNMYRRTTDSRNALAEQLRRLGLRTTTISDPANLCQNHEYWVIQKFSNIKTKKHLSIIEDILSTTK